MKGRTLLVGEDDERGERGEFGGSPLLAARAEPEITLAAAILNQAINDMQSRGMNRLAIQGNAHTAGFKTLDLEIETFLRGQVFSLIAGCLNIRPHVLRQLVYKHVRGNAQRKSA